MNAASTASPENRGEQTIQTSIPARLDRLPWSRFHWRIVIGLGTVWVLDGLEATIVGSIGGRLTEAGSGITLNASQIGSAAAAYIAGACLGALVFGQLTDRLGRKKLFMLTLGIYITGTVATGFSFAPWYFLLARFVAGMGIGGEYAAINSAIDELIPARVRGRVDLMINGSYWAGAALGGLGALLFLDTRLFAADLGWRFAFGVGAIIGLAVLWVRRNLPESPRWLFLHGREEEANRIVDQIEADVVRETGQPLPEATQTITVRRRVATPFREIAAVAFKRYPNRSVLGLSLFIGQAFLYNAVTFNLGTLLGEFYGVSSGNVPYYVLIFAIGNLLGPLTLGRLFDTVGRKPMISTTYLASAALAAILALLLLGNSLTSWTFIAVVGVTFFLASAGASAAYLTVSEIFPMEMRALSIAFFYAVGTAIGGISGPLLFGNFINSGNRHLVAIGFFIGAAVMAVGGIAELLLGVKAERRPLEDIAAPLGVVPTASRDVHDLQGARRYRPGPGRGLYSPGMPLPPPPAHDEGRLAIEVDSLVRALEEHGATDRDELARLVGARYWGPGRFAEALREAVAEGRVQRLPRSRFASRSTNPTAEDPREPAPS